MFIYLVAFVATLFIIFGLVHVRCLNDWLRSSICSSLRNGLFRRSEIEASFNNEDLESTFTSERSLTETGEVREFDDFLTQRAMFSNKERLSDVLLAETGNNSRNLNQPRYSFEDILSGERDRDFGIPATRALQLGTTKDDSIRATKQEGNENIFESLKSSIERSTNPSSRLNTSQIYNLILKETLKDKAARQKLLENEKSKFNESLPNKLVEHLPSRSENRSEREDDTNNTAKSDN
ncbi:uncharacterized protein LOC128886950 [Hylaeus anthracinus]|uniref:uncharacterized protein LOC128878747 n=1 Tax=Hylaeus volcanicus TaxID=313075 RepID=UPI0023B83314|nr:uncharacterized protein LOC128878747 [Hylaeus volcanicus]XP_053998221.1 uncharacterized protein LOC128886950 [Hylaeus anthracinus]